LDRFSGDMALNGMIASYRIDPTHSGSMSLMGGR